MNPYTQLDGRYFWSTAVAKRNMFDIDELWDPRFAIPRSARVAAFGSCFAQHFGRALRARGFNWLITERLPPGLGAENASKFNYDVFTARTGNIYTASLLKQWVAWACGDEDPPAEVWEQENRWYDPFRPNIEPGGFASKQELLDSRALTIEAFRAAVTQSDVFVFTLGLTESWFHRSGRYEYPMCPGTVAGTFDGAAHEFLNQDYPFIRQTLADAIGRMRKLNPGLQFLLTVSPVPLTATNSGNHVLVATMESKSVLRAVAGSLARELPFVDYFPSYEIINSTPFRGTFFEANQRSVHRAGVDHVMSTFFKCLDAKFPFEKGLPALPVAVQAEAAEGTKDAPQEAQGPVLDKAARQKLRAERQLLRAQRQQIRAGRLGAGRPKQDAAEVVCEEELLNAFSTKKESAAP